MRKFLIIGNWKLHGSKKMINNFITSYDKVINNYCNIAIALPSVYLNFAKSNFDSIHINLAAQNVDLHISGAFTGEISVTMLKDIGVKYVLIGHSERRLLHNENDECIAEKFCLLKKNNLIPILCLGEDNIKSTQDKIKEISIKQIDIILNKLGNKAFDNSVIAYEPTWAIGTGKVADSNQIQQLCKLIRNYISKHNKLSADQLILQYGGSINDKNICDLLTCTDLDGFLIGKSSLKVNTFLSIIKYVTKFKKENK